MTDFHVIESGLKVVLKHTEGLRGKELITVIRCETEEEAERVLKLFLHGPHKDDYAAAYKELSVVSRKIYINTRTEMVVQHTAEGWLSAEGE